MYNKAIELNVNFGEAYDGLGHALVRLGNKVEGEAMFGKVASTGQLVRRRSLKRLHSPVIARYLKKAGRAGRLSFAGSGACHSLDVANSASR